MITGYRASLQHVCKFSRNYFKPVQSNTPHKFHFYLRQMFQWFVKKESLNVNLMKQNAQGQGNW